MTPENIASIKKWFRPRRADADQQRWDLLLESAREYHDVSGYDDENWLDEIMEGAYWPNVADAIISMAEQLDVQHARLTDLEEIANARHGGEDITIETAVQRAAKLRRDFPYDASIMDMLIARIAELETELLGVMEECFQEMAVFVDPAEVDPSEKVAGERSGWWDSCGRSSACYYGDKLVGLGKWERHTEGHGRRWFYRPIPPPEETP